MSSPFSLYRKARKVHVNSIIPTEDYLHYHLQKERRGKLQLAPIYQKWVLNPPPPNPPPSATAAINSAIQ